MPRRLRSTETLDAFSEFLAEHPGLWPPRSPRGESADPFSEFETEVEAGDDRWLTIARGGKPTPIVHGYWHTIAAVTVVLSLLAPAGVIGTLIVGRELMVAPPTVLPTVPPAVPPLVPAQTFTASVTRLTEVPAARLPAAPKLSAESRSMAPPPLPRPPQPSTPAAVGPAPAPIAVMPLTTALLSSAPGPDVKLPSAPPPLNPAPAASVGPVLTPAPVIASPPVSSAPPEAPATPRPAGPTAATETAAVRATLDRFRNAFSTLDASGAKAVWPAVDERTLARAFNQMTEQKFVFDSCSIEVSGARATASCSGRAQYVPKVGSRTPRLEPRQWAFTLRRAEQDWSIESVDSR